MMKTYNVLFLNAYYDPEITADSHLINDLIEEMIKTNRWKVYVSCPTPTRGIDKATAKKYSAIKKEVLLNGMLTVSRFWAPPERKNTFLRFLRYIYCGIVQRYKCSKLKDIDLIYSISTPPFQGALSCKIKSILERKYKKKVYNVYYVEDIFPDTLISTGIIKSNKGFLWNLGRKIEDYSYKNSDKILTISPGCVNNIISKGVPQNKVLLAFNWIDLSNTRNIPRSNNKLFEKFNLPRDYFYVVYAGNLGEAQNPQIIIDAAKILEDKKQIKFLIIGTGGQEDKLKKRIEEERILNVKVFPLQPQSLISEVYSLGDLDVILCKKGLGKSALPSKTWSIMATSTPIISSFDIDGDLSKIIIDSNAGFTCDAEDSTEFANKIIEIYNMSVDERKKMGNNGRNYALLNHGRESCVRKIIYLFDSLVNLQ